MTERKVVGVFPAAECSSRRRLFAALASAFDVQFVGRDGTDLAGIDGAIVIEHPGGPDAAVAPVPMLVATSTERSFRAQVRFDDGPHVDQRLRGRDLRDDAVSLIRNPPFGAGEALIASVADGPVWLTSEAGGAKIHNVGAFPRELREGEPLKALIGAGSFIRLLPVVQFLRDLGARSWEPRPLRASFIVDDPNLHWRSYGHIRYPELADHAGRNGYHVGIAMVPIDAVFAHRPTLELFRRRPELSVLTHGNDHIKWELARRYTFGAAHALAAESLSRMTRFERKYGVEICRVIVPPHDDCERPRPQGVHPPPGACSEQMMEALLRVGFEAVCYYGPTGDSTGRSLIGWFPADVHVGGGLPGIHRVTLEATVDELILRWYLDQPLVLFGHQGNLSDLDLLAEAAARINSLGDVAWCSMTGIARSNFSTRRDGTTLHLRSFSRRLSVDIPAGVQRVAVEFAGAQLDPPRLVIARTKRVDGAPPVTAEVGDPLAVAGPCTVDITAGIRDTGPDELPPMPPKLWPLLRRCLTEGRDRLTPLVRR